MIDEEFSGEVVLSEDGESRARVVKKLALGMCETCVFCKMTPGGDFQCRKNPPRAHLLVTPNGPAWMASFPKVNKDWGCGEYHPDTVEEDAGDGSA